LQRLGIAPRDQPELVLAITAAPANSYGAQAAHPGVSRQPPDLHRADLNSVSGCLFVLDPKANATWSNAVQIRDPALRQPTFDGCEKALRKVLTKKLTKASVALAHAARYFFCISWVSNSYPHLVHFRSRIISFPSRLVRVTLLTLLHFGQLNVAPPRSRLILRGITKPLR
jgi:hypothetical protein